MKKKKRKFNPQLIKARRSYTFAEIAEFYGVDKRTVQRWRKEGMHIFDQTTLPFLVMGEDVKKFLKGQESKKKCRLKPDEFFCTRCKAPRLSESEKLYTERTNKKLGKTCTLNIIKGICNVCGNKVNRFSSEKIKTRDDTNNTDDTINRLSAL